MPYHGLLYMKFEYEGTLNPPFGLFGGLPGNGGCKYKETPDGKRYFYQAHPDPDAFGRASAMSASAPAAAATAARWTAPGGLGAEAGAR